MYTARKTYLNVSQDDMYGRNIQFCDLCSMLTSISKFKSSFCTNIFISSRITLFKLNNNERGKKRTRSWVDFVRLVEIAELYVYKTFF